MTWYTGVPVNENYAKVWHLTAYETITVTSWYAPRPGFTNCFDRISDFAVTGCQCRNTNRVSSK